MSYEEYVRWRLYAEKYGIMSTSRSLERVGALIAQSMRGGKFEDYLPQRGEIQQTEPIDHVQAMKLMGGKVVRR